MRSFFKNYFFAVWTAIIIMINSVVYQVYALDDVVDPTGQKLPSINFDSRGAGSAVAQFISYAIAITSILAIIAITWAGITMFLSIGQEEKFIRARTTMIFALVGVALAGGAYLIVRIISGLKFD